MSNATHLLTLHGLVTAIAVLFYVSSSHALQQRRSPTVAIAWVVALLLVPYLALPAYWTFGFRKLPRPRAELPVIGLRGCPADDWAVRTSLALGQPEPLAYRQLEIHSNGEQAKRSLLHAINAARHSIDLCTFLLRPDAVGTDVLERLCAKARDGVRVRLLLDGLGALMGGRPDLKPLSAAGGAWTVFVPPLSSALTGRTNLRNHRKLLVTDAGHEEASLWCGGRNIATEYFAGQAGTPAWHDLSFDLKGPAVQQAHALFEHDWAFANRLPGSAAARLPPAAQNPARGVQLIASGPDQADDTIHALLLSACYQAQQRITLVTAYFVPDEALLTALCLAARRGVEVDLLIPRRSNHWLSDMARTRSLRTLAQAGARVWLAAGMLHAKLVVVDATLALAGSANLDTRSLFLNYELMVAFHARTDVQRFFAWSEHERSAMTSYVATPPGIIRDVAEGLLLWVGFQL
jgi:cardiolipin synthase